MSIWIQNLKLDGGVCVLADDETSEKCPKFKYSFLYFHQHLYPQNNSESNLLEIVSCMEIKMYLSSNTVAHGLTSRGLDYTTNHSENVQSQTFWIITYLAITWRFNGVAPFSKAMLCQWYIEITNPRSPEEKGNTKQYPDYCPPRWSVFSLVWNWVLLHYIWCDSRIFRNTYSLFCLQLLSDWHEIISPHRLQFIRMVFKNKTYPPVDLLQNFSEFMFGNREWQRYCGKPGISRIQHSLNPLPVKKPAVDLSGKF